MSDPQQSFEVIVKGDVPLDGASQILDYLHAALEAAGVRFFFDLGTDRFGFDGPNGRVWVLWEPRLVRND